MTLRVCISDWRTEASWGADPLEYFGGFRTLQYNAEAKYKSSLATNGLVSWSRQQHESDPNDTNEAAAFLTVLFHNVDWHFLQSVYGWAALQYQAWARGYINVEPECVQNVALYTDNVLEFWVDDKHYFGGDYYSYRRAPVVLHLGRGNHRIDARLIRDARVMGAVGEASISINIRAMIMHDSLTVDDQRFLFSDMIHGSLAGSFASVPIRNNTREWIDVWDAAAENVCHGNMRPSPLLMENRGNVCYRHACKDALQPSPRPIETSMSQYLHCECVG